MEREIKNRNRLIRPCEIQAVVELDEFLTHLSGKYGVYPNERDNFGCLDMDKPLVSHIYKSNIFYFLFGNSSNKCHVPKFGKRPYPFNRVVTADTFKGEDHKTPLKLTDSELEKLVTLRQAASDAIEAAYPKKPHFSDELTTIEDYDKALREQGFADGTHRLSVKINGFSIEYERVGSNQAPYFSTGYKGWQNQEDMPHNSLLYQFYRKWNVFHCVEMTIDEYNEMKADVDELKNSFVKKHG